MLDCVLLFFELYSCLISEILFFILHTQYVSTEGVSLYDNLKEKDGIIKIQNDFKRIKLTYPDSYIFLAGYTNARTKNIPVYFR